MKLLDSTFIVDFLRKRIESERALEILRGETVFTTRINFFEVLTGIFSLKSEAERERHFADAFMLFERIGILELDEKSAIKASQIAGELNKSGAHIEPNDCLTAGISLSNEIEIIVTRNIKHFQAIKGLKIETY